MLLPRAYAYAPWTRNSRSDQFASKGSESAIYGSTDYWASYPQTESNCMLPKYTGLPLDSTREPEILFTFKRDFSRFRRNHRYAHGKLVLNSLLTDLDTQSDMNASLAGSNLSMYPISALSTVGNAQQDSHNTATTSPPHTRFHVEQGSPLSVSNPLIGSQIYSFAPSYYPSFTNDAVSLSSKHRRDSLYSNTESHFSKARAGRRRGPEHVGLGTARAIHLEKNRKAASRCRTKQRRQQDKLVETAHDMERRNKTLKAAIEILDNEVHGLMEVASQHTECSDARLKLYLQRKADQMVCQSEQTTLSTSCSGRPSPSPARRDNTLSPDKD